MEKNKQELLSFKGTLPMSASHDAIEPGETFLVAST